MTHTPARTSNGRVRTPKASPTKPVRPTEKLLDETLARLKRNGTKANRDGMARYAIPSDKALGVSVGTLKNLAKELGPNHDLAEALWQTGWYEARMLASFVGEPSRVTSAQNGPLGQGL